MSNEELKPCPFCGAGAMSHTEPERVVIGCFRAKCAVNPSLNATTTKRASELWNKRVSDRPEQENAELREALHLMVDFAVHQMNPHQNDPSIFDDEDFGNLNHAKKLLNK